MKVFNRIGLITTLAFLLVLSLAVTGLAQRRGPWVDEVIIIEEPSDAAAISRLESGEIDVYAYSVSNAELYKKVQANPKLDYQMSFGSYNELSFNTVGPIFSGSGKLNPFSVPRIREAMNMLIDRDYIADEIYGGMAIPKYFSVTASFPDYARYADVCRVLELKYAHDQQEADRIISEEMVKLGAERVGGKWYYKGEPVEIKILIRIEDERREIGDYIGNCLDAIGFSCTLDYRTAAEASPIWYSGDPNEGKFHIYTGGWVTTVVARDQADTFAYFYTNLGLATPLWLSYENDPEFYEVAEKLANQEFKTMDQRRELFSKALELSLKDSTRLWIVDQTSFAPHLANISVTGDLAGSISGSYLWAHTIRRGQEVGGTIHMAMPSILTEPWNPLDGTNWIYDMGAIRPTGDMGYMWDPYTGMHYPDKVEKADLYIQKDLPVSQTLDWVTVHKVDTNHVPKDAWIDWDPVAQKFITVGEKNPEGLTALRRTVVQFPRDMYQTTKWHDGSPISAADFVLSMIMTFDRANEQSKFYDSSKAPSFKSWQPTFKGFRVTSVDPLVIETWTDIFYLDAEYYNGGNYPVYAQGTGGWHNVALGIHAEIAGEVAFSSDKSTREKIEWTNYIGGPSLNILSKHLDQVSREGWIPYSATMSQFISPQEATLRWNNLKKWYNDKGHFWVGTGPFYLDKAYHLEKVVHLKRNTEYAYESGRWDIFTEPMISEVEITGKRVIQIGKESKFDIAITFNGKPYPTEDLDKVTYMVFDARGNLAHVGEAECVSEGNWQAVLTPAQTSKLVVGASRLEIAVVSKVVSIPTFEKAEFVTYR